MLSSKQNIACINLRLKIIRILYQHRVLFLLVCAFVIINVVAILSSHHRLQHIAYDTTSCNTNTSFLVIGDWGIVDEKNKDYQNKLKVGKAMSVIQQQYNTSFVISVGDQYYDHGVHLLNPLKDLKTSNDLKYWFIDHFENAYDKALSPWYLILGNHDMRGSAHALFKYSNISDRWNMPYNYYYKDFPINTGEYLHYFRIIFIDTSSIMCHHEDIENLDSLESWSCEEAWYHYNDHRKSEYNEKDEDKFVNREIQIQWIKETIASADTDDSISSIFISGHHCLWSNGPHGCPKVMGQNMRPLFKLSKKIKTYFCGHNHGLEHFEWSKDNDDFEVHTFLVGAGASLHGMNDGRCKFDELIDDINSDGQNENIELKYLGISLGFMSVHLEGNNDRNAMMIRYWNQDAKLLYEAMI